MIGIFDSGVGGMTVARAIETALPDYPITYLGDIAKTPYGNKSAETITDYSLRNTEFLLNKGAEIIVIACNSAASVATKRLRHEFKVPIFEVISPAVDRATRHTKSGRIGVIGTRATIRSTIYEQKILAVGESFKVFPQPCPLLVPLVEEDWINKKETKMILRRYLQPLKNKQVDTLVLGCTHYPLLKKLIQPRIGKRVKLIDSSVAVAHSIRDYIGVKPARVTKSHDQDPQHRYYVSDLTDSAEKIAEKLFGRKIELILI